MDIHLSHDTPEAFCHFNQTAFILFVMSSSTSPLLCIINPRYINWFLSASISHAIITNSLLLCLLLLNVHSRYLILVLINLKPLESKASHYNSNL